MTLSKLHVNVHSAEAKEAADRYNEQYIHNPAWNRTPIAMAWDLEAARTIRPLESKICNHQGDNKASLYYYDKERLLAFHWDGEYGHPVEVAHGGDHEPVVWTFEYSQHRPDIIVAGTRSCVLTFQMTCQRWIEAIEDAR